MRTIGNVIWLVFGGVFIAIEYLVSSIVMMITIIGIPFGIQTLKLAMLALWPFGSEIREVPQSVGCLSIIMNILWFFVGGIWICLSHLGFGILFAITIIGLPFAKQHFKLASLALTPFGREVVDRR
ncbi:YccF domain-containing protein [Reichenbachiella agarivorans]|uniref:YccF domain-containing protein n=1 Tax=Reichenbachiella agarivorans TaxID=2979464 RepID=A0ABY6CTZ1_9BACT|nr:YccF domain-containing protein [Reichenbachiella agarivorans]UXP33799.1 YccF domain-containing protein [Reichenbachiella agarivorans]